MALRETFATLKQAGETISSTAALRMPVQVGIQSVWFRPDISQYGCTTRKCFIIMRFYEIKNIEGLIFFDVEVLKEEINAMFHVKEEGRGLK